MSGLLWRARNWVRFLVITAGVGFGGFACGDGEGMDAGETGDAEPDEPPKPPVFVDLGEDPELVLEATAVDDVVLAVADLRPNTRVEVDGMSWQPGAGAPAVREDDALRIPLGGAMVVGEHTLELVHVVGDEALRSGPVRVSIVAGPLGVLSASLGVEPKGAGDRLVAHGQGPEAIFGVVDEAGERVIVRAGSWSAEGFELGVPGLALEPGFTRPGIDLSIAHVGGERWVVAAWRAEQGQVVRGRIQIVDGPGAPQGEASEVFELWDLDSAALDATLGPHELARIEAVTLLERTLVLGVDARRDLEQHSIGDHLLATRFIAADATPAMPVIVRGPSGQDLDLPADARAWTYAGHGAVTSARVGLVAPWLLAVAANGLPQLVEAPDATAATPSGASFMRSAEGAFGSRHAFALEGQDGEARVVVLRIDRWSEGSGDPGEGVDVIELPAWPSGAPSLGLLDGAPTFVVPLGPDADALAVRSTGAGAEVAAIPDLRCGELALASAGFEGIGDTLPLACLVAGELWTGFLGVD